MKKVVLKVMLGVCVLSVVTFSVLIIRELYIDSQSRSFYDDVANIETRPREPAVAGNAQNGANQNPDGTPGDEPAEPEEWLPYVDFDALMELFPEVVGWIKLDDTPIDYPIVQFSDNDFFLTRLPDGTAHRNGSIFLDYRNKDDFSDKSILIYGHETRAGDMFGTLKHYRSQEFYDSNPVIDIYTPEKDYKLILFAGHLAHSIRDHPPLEFESDDDFLYYIRQIRNKSVFNSNVEVTAEDKIVSLVTCAYDFNEARLIVAGILIER